MVRFVGTAQHGKVSLLYFYLTKKGAVRNLSAAESHDGVSFAGSIRDVVVHDGNRKPEKRYDWKSFRLSKQEDRYFLTYKHSVKTQPYLLGATSIDLLNWEQTGNVDHIKETGTVIPEYKYRDHYVMYFGEKKIKIAYSAYLYHWKAQQRALLEPRKNEFDSGDLEVGNAYRLDGQILLTYYVKKKEGHKTHVAVGAALFDASDPTELLWRSPEPIWDSSHQFGDDTLTPLGSVILHDELILYWLVNDADVITVSCPVPTTRADLRQKSFSHIVKKHGKNPIIAPRPDKPWESRATFNPAAVYENGKVHFIYRALGDKDLSVLGYAVSRDGLHIDERSEEPIYVPREPFETPGGNAFKTFADHFASGGGYGGVEDPRITKVGDTFYMTYVAFDGANPPRVALTSISVDNFINRRWDTWETPKLISAPGMVNKNAVIFPEKINGKYVVFHRIYPNILIDYVDDLSFEDTYLKGHHFIPPRKRYWDSKKVGAGAPPIKTDDGWLFVYQSVGYQDPGRYKIGAMLLDHNDPSKVICRTNAPIVEPVEPYENEGFKAGVVYPCGAVIMDNKLHVYYGGADTVVCAASADADEFLSAMKRNREPKLRRVKAPIFN